MPVASYTIEQGAVQKDGRLSVVERYLREDGSEAMFCSLIDAKADLDAYAAQRIATLDADEARPVPEQDPFEAKIEAARAAYKADNAALTRQLLAEAALAIDAKADAVIANG